MTRLRSAFCQWVVFILIFNALPACQDNRGSGGQLKLALVQYNDSPLSELSKQGIEEGLKLAGLQEGTDFEMKVYNAQGDVATLNMIFDAVTATRPKVIFVTSTPTLQMAIKKIKNIPVVFTCIGDPILAGTGKSFEDHLPNVTGISTLGDYEGMASLLPKIIPGIRKVGTLYTPGEINSQRNMEEFRQHLAAREIELLAVPVNSSSETTDAILSLIARKPEVICQVIDNLTALSISNIIRAGQEHEIPVFGFVSDQAEKGAVLVISRDYVQAGIDAAGLAKKILDGTSPGSLPIQFVSKTNLLINREAALLYNISIPDEIPGMENAINVK
jgi:ABC-type uncharacterized transport system substrate-binding protein